MIGVVAKRSDLAVTGGWRPVGDGNPEVTFAYLDSGSVAVRDRTFRQLAIAVGDRAYVCPLWSTLHTRIDCGQGFVWFIWTPTQEGYQNVIAGNAHRYIVVFRPDGEVEEFRGLEAMPIGGKMFSIRPYHWADPNVPDSSLNDRRVAVWDGVEGPPLAEIRDVVESRGVPVYIGRKNGRCWRQCPNESVKVVIRHPNEVLFEGAVADWHFISRTPDALPVKSTVYGVGIRLTTMPDGSVLWGVSRGNVVTLYRDGREVLSGDIVALHERHEDGVLTAIERTAGDGRVIHELG